MKRCVLFLFLTVVLSAQSAPEVEITAEPHHHQVLANDYVRVFNVEVPAHSDTLMHWHRHDYIYVTLGTTKVVNAVKGKDPVSITLADGDARFLPATFAHIARDVDDHPFKNVTIELLQDEKLRQSPAHWDPAHPEDDRGLQVLHGGTQEILFVKDGVRVSEFDLQQPQGEAIVSPGPYLLVALTDLKLFQMEHNAPVSFGSAYIQLKPGEVRWISSPHRSTLTHHGPPAKFIILEFP